METQLQVLVELTIAEGKVEEFKTQMPPIIEKVMANEPDMLGYQWYLNQDQKKCYIIEWLKNSEAWLTHVSNVESMLPPLFAIAPITRCEFFGNVSEAVEEAIVTISARFNLDIINHKYLAGFIR